MYEELLASIQEREPWLRDFGRQTYRDAFRSYTERFGPLFMEAVRNQDPADLAKALLDGLDAGWRAQRFWRRGVVRAEEKQMVVVYLSPMLLGLEEAGCQSLAQALMEQWAARWPGDGYRMAPYDQIQAGFRNAIMGIELRR
ncbi:MAG: hypothetical protein V8R55_01200 [Dysosmobacter sp.]